MINNIMQIIEQKSKNPITFLIGIISTLSMILSSILGAYDFIKKFPSPYNYLGLTVLLISTFLTISLFLLTINYSRKYEIPLSSRYILTKVKQTCHFNKYGDRFFSQEKTFFFIATPTKDDLFDNQLSSKELLFDDLKYSSSDSKIIDIEKIPNKNICKIYWQPIQGTVKKATPYTHSFECYYPKQDLKIENTSFITISTSAYIQDFILEISSERKICSAIAYKKQWGQSLNKPEEIITFATKIKKTNSPPLHFSEAGHLIWHHEELSRGDIYFIVIEFSD